MMTEETVPEPEVGDIVARVGTSRGVNLFEVDVAIDKDGGVTKGDGLPVERSLSRLPSKFHKTIWIKRGCYLICPQSDGQVELTKSAKGGKSKFNYNVKHILLDDQVKHLRVLARCF